jgi:dynein heavy chain
LIRLEFDTPAGTLKKIKDSETKIIKNEIYMATVDLRAKAHFIELMIKSNYPVVLIGKTGSGKSKFMDYLQASLNPEVYASLPIKMRRSMTYEEFKDILFTKTRISFKTVHKKCFCSSTNKKLIIFIDDFNILDINSQIGEFMLTCIKDGYYYDTATNEKIFIYNISFVVAENDTYESRIDNKFMKYFKPIYINEIEPKDIC